jgi:ABC-type branched-subunit amino acid transport system substrate-binding protein
MDRRTFLTRTGGLATVTMLAGCGGDGGDGSDGDGGDGSDGGDGGDGGDGSDGGDDGDMEDGGDGGSTDGGDGDIQVGVLVPFSGDYAWVGENVLPVARMVAEEINSNGGIGGRNVSIVQGDTEASPDASLTAAQQLIEVEGVAGIIGPTSLTYSAVADSFTQNQVPTVSPTAGTTTLDDQGGEYVFRTVPSDALGGRAIARAAREEQYNATQSYDQMTMMVGDREVFQSFSDPISSSFEEFGGTINETIDFRTGKSSYQSEVQSMMSTESEITVLVASIEDSVKIMEAAFQAGYEGNWFVTQDQTNQDFLSQSENQVTDGILGLQEAPFQEAQESGRSEAFNSDIQEFAGWDETRLFATNTYDAMNVLGLALHQTATAGSDLTGANVAGNIRTVANPPEQAVTNFADGASAIENGTDVDYRGLVGPIDFDDNGDIVAPFSIQKAEGGEWSEASLIPPEAL